MNEQRENLNIAVGKKDTKTPQKQYVSTLTDTIKHKLGKNQIKSLEETDRLFYEGLNGEWVYTSFDDKTKITQNVVSEVSQDVKRFPMISVETSKILDLLSIQLYKNFNGATRIYNQGLTIDEVKQKATVYLNVSDYMEKRNLKDRKTAKAYIKQASDEIFNKTIVHTFPIIRETTDKKGKVKRIKEDVEIEFRLISARAKFKNSGDVIFRFDADGVQYLTEYSQNALLPLLKLDGVPYQIGDYLNRHYEQNKGRDICNRLSVKKILENVDIMEVSQVKNRKYKEKIKLPFIQSLGELKNNGILQEFYLYDKNGTKYNTYDAQELPINTFMGLFLYYVISETA